MNQQNAPLWRQEFEHDSCGTGFVAHVNGKKSHSIVTDALEILNRLVHRGGTGADPDTGDGAGILMQIPDQLFRKQVEFTLPEAGKYAVGMLFLPLDSELRAKCVTLINERIAAEGLTLLGWRKVPINLHACGNGARVSAPSVQQVFVGWPSENTEFDISLFALKKGIETKASEQNLNIYINSLSDKTIVYKGMMQSWQVSEFYPDLQNNDCISAIALVHSRYSTNTFPSWHRAQPCRFIAHNGEINTLRGVESAALSAATAMDGGRLKARLKDCLPILDATGSDSTKFDNLVEFLTLSGRPLPQVLFMMMPGPWSKDDTMDDQTRDFFKYAACLMPPWDGPACMCFTDGNQVGTMLDRNGLRPARWMLTRQGRMILSSESGVLDIPPEDIIRRGKLGPNQMVMLDISTGKIMEDADLRETYMKGPWTDWLKENIVHVTDEGHGVSLPKRADSANVPHYFGWTHEDRINGLLPMAQNALDPIGAMGFDAPLAVLSDKPQPLFNYFKEHFAQVTNPPIDSIQEECVTGMDMFLGANGDPTLDIASNCIKMHIPSPVLSAGMFEKVRQGAPGLSSAEIPMLFNPSEGLEKGMETLFAAASTALDKGAAILILTDRDFTDELPAIPSLLAVSGLHHYLIQNGQRHLCSIVVDSYEPREVHHLACLVGYGAKAVYLRGVFEAAEELFDKGFMQNITLEKAKENLEFGFDHGLLKVMSKMGISCVDGYHSAQIFEAVGISEQVVKKYFCGTVSRLSGMTLADLENETIKRHMAGILEKDTPLKSGGRFQWKRDGEQHLYNPETIHILQTAARTDDYNLYKEYKRRIEQEHMVTIRSMLSFVERTPVSIEEVEPVERIVKRFKTGAMSYGSISLEAHECLALAMNQLGGKSNSGEGGEAVERLYTNKNSAIKQIASGRFGVTGPYLASAKEIQIKMAQGAKPGEGGQLPGGKVYPWVAKVRHSTPGVGLISPPPHHDIYSIEDLAQLIFDLKNANPVAKINVKLVSETGVGTVAAGVAKGGADVILISGYDGGTGASPKTSIQHAGLPWEIGLAETHQTLMMNGLRGRVRVETDGKLMTGRDVAIAALLGAEEFGFATLPLVAIGCIMMRVCNLDTCPVGVATQNPALRARFTGKPEHVVNLMTFIAQDLREVMASLGFRTIDEMVGCASVLKQTKQSPKTAGLDLSPLTTSDMPLPWRDLMPHKDEHSRLFHDMVRSLIERGEEALVERPISNVERAVGTSIGAFISKEYGKLPDGRVKFRFKGTAGQSFGAFVPKGIELFLEGDANDYLGKGLSGARIIVKKPVNAAWNDEDNILIGNVALFGATEGELYLAGKAGERFCVRNSGAKAVCEGVGDHGCEYMTGGIAVILGAVGRNFASGMSGGIAYVLDTPGFRDRVNKKMVGLYDLDAMDTVNLYKLIMKHVDYTDSAIGKTILDKWPKMISRFVKVLPHDYKQMLEAMETAETEGYEGDSLLERAFNIKTGKGR